MPDSKSPEIVVITGASAGVGRATVREFARHGAHIGLVARGRDGLDGARRDVEAAGGKALVLPADVADPNRVEAAATAVEDELGPIDTWVNGAMTTVFAPFLEIKPEEYKRATEVTYLGYVYGTLAALQRMCPRNRGTIVQVGSALAYRSIPLQAPYCGAKAAIRGFTDSIRTELKHAESKVHITMVQMPGLNTPQFDWCLTRLPNHPQPVPPIYDPEVAARAIYWAAHHQRREWYVGGSTLGSILGNMVAPGVLDAYLGKTGYDSQQTSEPVDPNRRVNLFEPVPGDHGARGPFTSQSHTRSIQAMADRRRGVLALAGAALAGAAAAFWESRR